MHVVIAGQGYVGLPLAVRAAEVGHRVIGYDVDTDQHRGVPRSLLRLPAPVFSTPYLVMCRSACVPTSPPGS
jgi:nucleoside-diphosphate-sugar epimerase